MPEVYIDGEFVSEKEAKISIFDRAVQLGDGLFETVRGHNGRPAFIHQHLERMRNSAEFLKIHFDIDDKSMKNILVELCQRNKASEARIRITLTRGIHPEGFALEGGKPSLIATAEEYEPHSPDKYREGYRLVISKIIHFSGSVLAGLKTLNYLEFLLARDEAFSAGADEALLVNEKGNVTECSSANIFCITDDKLVAPGLDSGILPGVVRDVIIALARREHILVEERNVTVDELLSAREVFITSSLRGVMPVCRIGDTVFKNRRSIMEKLSLLYLEGLDAACRE